MLVERIIQRLCTIQNIDHSVVMEIILLVKQENYLSKKGAIQLNDLGIPIFSIVSNILSLNQNELDDIFLKRKISYSDLVCIIGIVTQDSLVQYQKRRLANY